MSWFARIEQACAAFIERTFAKTFPGNLEPAQIARKLVSTMEARTRGGEGHLFAPGSYVVFVNPEDLARLGEHRAYLERQWGELLRDMAGRVGVYFSDGGPNVRMQARESIPSGTIDVMVASDLTIQVAADVVEAADAYVLRMVKGVPASAVYSLSGTASIGRNEECDVFLVDPSVSRNHAEIAVDADGPLVRDLGSTNGTFLNGERLHGERRARPGDLLMVGNTQLRIEGRT
ncbi:MAG: DUF3662 and FHA domain-containing protein [Candidatus Eremiobacteraeota bacterium]|nr:DUF3662 and FHA domain-containing protein [Candidatus Eremiobacteraeota bacterium]